MRRTLFGVITLVGVLTAWTIASAQAPELTVIVNQGAVSGVRDIAAGYEKLTGRRVVVDFGGPVPAGQKIQNDAPGDLIVDFLPAFDNYIKDGKVIGPVVEFAKAGNGVAVKAGAPKPDISTVEGFKQAMLNAKSIGHSAAGTGPYNTKLFQKLGIYDQIKDKVHIVMGKLVAQAVADGDVEIGLQQTNVIQPVAGTTYLGPLPAELIEYGRFGVAVRNVSKNEAAARELIKFMTSPEAVPLLGKSTMEPSLAVAAAAAPQGRGGRGEAPAGQAGGGRGGAAVNPPKNLKLLAANTDIRFVMEAFNEALGVQCTYCHVQGDFAADTNPKKEIARKMIAMVRLVDTSFPSTAGVFPDGYHEVDCSTCHRGSVTPETVAPRKFYNRGNSLGGPEPEQRPGVSLKLLPSDTHVHGANSLMGEFRDALNVDCNYCHGGDKPQQFDLNPRKDIARKMILLVRQINQQFPGTGVYPVGEQKVTCWTCHHGDTHPVSLANKRYDPPAAK
jgi:molybdate transport system substrate-binding protein